MSFTVPLVSVMVATEDFVASVTELAVKVTAEELGTVAGAVKVAGVALGVVEVLMVPHAGEHAVPFCVSTQFTPALLGSYVTVTMNCWVALMGIIPLGGETADTRMAGTVMSADADWVASATEVAVRMTLKSLAGGVFGAV
jgi:hypothetical protein